VDNFLDVTLDPPWVPQNKRLGILVRMVSATRVLLGFRMERFMWSRVLVMGVKLLSMPIGFNM
jgi:hypothetical protein